MNRFFETGIEGTIDLLLALVRHWVARFRRRFVDANARAFSLADELDYARFCRKLNKPIAEPERSFLEEDLDIFDGVKLYNA